ncbi:MAG: type II CRISPR RNA-guided endonuclease Cas9 [Armatimonadetes bacterium]|nr:type II CRISPR RNA-guided endonuclease Cas9 [Armatimonadota bacterium]
MRYVLGLDIGITSVGWAVYNLDRTRIEALGVRAFNAAEIPNTKESLAKPRRDARSVRRRLRRRRGRLNRAKELFEKFGLVSNADVLFPDEPHSYNPDHDPWKLRADGLDRLLTGEQFARALYHIAKHRGFKSNRKHGAPEDQEAKKMLEGLQGIRRMLEESGCRTIGELFYKHFTERKRNREGDYSHTIERALLEDEVSKLFEAQHRLGSKFASQDFKSEFLQEAFNWQKPFASGDDIFKKVGLCTFEGINGERRAPRASYTAERFDLLQKINNIEIACNGERRRLNPEERLTILEMAYQFNKVTYEQIRKQLNLPEEARFAGVSIQYRKFQEGKWVEDLSCEKSTFRQLAAYHGLRKAFEPEGLWNTVKDNPDLMDDLAFALTFYKTDEDIRAYLSERGVSPEIIDVALKAPTFTSVTNLSIKAMRKMMPYLEQGMKYHDAATAAGYFHYNPKGETERTGKLPVIDRENITSPVVFRALTQARKVVNHIIDRYGPPTYVNIELARDIGKSRKARDELTKQMEKNRRIREEYETRFKEDLSKEPQGDDLDKYRLYHEQNGQCPYSQKPIELDRLLEPGYVEIDHILPYSRSLDNRFSNKVLVFAQENHNKGNRTPYEYFGSTERWPAFEAWVKANIRDRDKLDNLLTKNFATREKEFMERNLTDTRWAAKFFAEFIRQNLEFAELSEPSLKGSPSNSFSSQEEVSIFSSSPERARGKSDQRYRVRCFAGGITSVARGLWGLGRARREKEEAADDLHHALDAAVIAVLTPGRVKLITEYCKAKETGKLTRMVDPDTGEVYEVLKGKPFEFPPPWKHFRKELLARLSDDPAGQIAALNLPSYAEDPPDLSPIIVSRMQIRKASGALHAETIRSIREVEGKRVSVVRRKLTDLSKADLDKLCDPQTNKALYAEIRRRMEAHNFNAKKAFAEPLYKPSRPGKKAPVVRSVKVCESQPSGIEVRKGIADNNNMVRCDVFTKDGKYYLVPVYTCHIARGVLPNRAIVAHKSESEWLEMDDSYEFLFSLYPYDLVRVKTKTGEFIGYYRIVDRSTGAIGLSEPQKNASDLKRFGTRTLQLMEKYQVGVLGEIRLVKRERRVGVANCSDLKSG